jgi:hypothetical protein
MKIHSKFKDYYDSALGSFLDSEVVFKRMPSIEPHSILDFPSLGEDFHGLMHSPRSYLSEHRGLVIDPFLKERCELYSFWVGFCGKYYPFVTPGGTVGEMVWSRLSKDAVKDPMSTELSKFFKETVRFNVEPSDFATVSKFSRFDIDFKMSIGMKIPDNLMSDNFKNPEETIFWKDEAFERFGPIFMAVFPVQSKYVSDRDKAKIWIFKNPCLKTIGFQRVKDPYTALWEIEHWIDSHARPDDAVVPVGDDLTRLQAYGFDKKTSFRKAKETK